MCASGVVPDKVISLVAINWNKIALFYSCNSTVRSRSWQWICYTRECSNYKMWNTVICCRLHKRWYVAWFWRRRILSKCRSLWYLIAYRSASSYMNYIRSRVVFHQINLLSFVSILLFNRSFSKYLLRFSMENTESPDRVQFVMSISSMMIG